MAVALVAPKLTIPLAHLESGLRSFDRTMPEEVNRVVPDQLSDHLFIHSEEAADNLRREGVAQERIHFVGNTMIGSLVVMAPRFRDLDAAGHMGLERGEYLLVTLHRPALVDGPLLNDVLDQPATVALQLPVVFPAYPRTRMRMLGFGTDPDVHVLDPVGYLEFLSLQADAAAVLTDSGGVQEETTFLGVPCFTLRDNTERPVTITAGTNTLLGLDPGGVALILPAVRRHRVRRGPDAISLPPGWDGRASSRLADVICPWVGGQPESTAEPARPR